MPRYYFDILDDDGLFCDEQGMDLANMDAAVTVARRTLSDMVRDAFEKAGHADLSIKVRDGAEGPVLLTVRLDTTLERP